MYIQGKQIIKLLLSLDDPAIKIKPVTTHLPWNYFLNNYKVVILK